MMLEKLAFNGTIKREIPWWVLMTVLFVMAYNH
jgi:hypothetical protein